MTALSRLMLTGVCLAAASASFCASQEKDSRPQGKKPAASGPFGSVLLPTSATCAAFSADSKSIALGSGVDGTVTIWDCAGKILQKLPLQKTGVVSHVAFSANGKLLESRIHDNVGDQVVITIRLWDLDAKKITFQREVSFEAGRSARFSADFQKLALPEGDNAVTIWDAVKDKKMRTHDWSGRDVVDFCFDGKDNLLVMTHSRNKKDECKAHVWDATAGKKIREVPCIGNPISAPGGKYFTGVIALGPCVGGFVVLGNAETGDAVPLIYLDEQDFGQPTFAPDGKLLMVPLGTAAKAPTGVMYAQVWDAKNAKHLFSVGMPGEVYSACMSPSNDKIALVGAKQTLVQPLKIFKHFGGAATITCISPDAGADSGRAPVCSFLPSISFRRYPSVGSCEEIFRRA